MPTVDRFCLDTSFLINAWWKRYRRDVFPTLWTKLDGLLSGGTVSSCEEIFEELKDQRDELYDWANGHKVAFHAPSAQTIAEFKAVMAKYPNFAAASSAHKNGADPWVIAQAKVSNLIVVTDEEPGKTKKTKPPKIPSVCEDLGLRWVSPIDFLKRVGIKL